MPIDPCLDCLDMEQPLCACPDGTRDLARLAHGYLRHEGDDAIPHSTAFGCVFALECDAPEEALSLVFVAHDLVRNEEERAYLAAGALERLLIKHGPRVVDRIVEKARREPLFRRCLSGVWGRDHLAPEVAARIDALLGPVRPKMGR